MELSSFSALQPSNNNYLLVVKGKPEGPYTIAELKAFKIKPADFVRSPGMDDYKEAHEIPELRYILGFAKPAHIPQYFAGFDQRLLASALDWFIISGVYIIIMLIFILFAQDKVYQFAIIFGLGLMIPVTKLIYHIIMESSARQATIGKLILNIKVCDLNGERLTFSLSAGRNFAKIFSVLTLFTGYLFAFFNVKQQCLHDMIAGTLVMKDRLI